MHGCPEERQNQNDVTLERKPVLTPTSQATRSTISSTQACGANVLNRQISVTSYVTLNAVNTPQFEALMEERGPFHPSVEFRARAERNAFASKDRSDNCLGPSVSSSDLTDTTDDVSVGSVTAVTSSGDVYMQTNGKSTPFTECARVVPTLSRNGYCPKLCFEGQHNNMTSCNSSASLKQLEFESSEQSNCSLSQTVVDLLQHVPYTSTDHIIQADSSRDANIVTLFKDSTLKRTGSNNGYTQHATPILNTTVKNHTDQLNTTLYKAGHKTVLESVELSPLLTSEPDDLDVKKTVAELLQTPPSSFLSQTSDTTVLSSDTQQQPDTLPPNFLDTLQFL